MTARPFPSAAPARRQRGVTVVVVLVLMTAMLLGGLALARMTETGTLVFGNVVSKDGSLQASELGINAAYLKVRTAGFAQDVDAGGWYRASIQATDANGIPNVDFEGAGNDVPKLNNRFTVRYFVERMCNANVVVDTLQQCLVRMQKPKVTSADAGGPQIAPPNLRQFRITVRVTDERGTATWVQTLATIR